MAKYAPFDADAHFDSTRAEQLLGKCSAVPWHAKWAGRMPALVRLKGRWDRAVKVRLCAMKNRAASNRNCVAEMRGGEQRNENDQSVTQIVRKDGRRELDSVGVDGRVFERKTKSVERAIGEELNRRTAGKAPGRHADGWRRNGRKSQRSNQGDPSGASGVHGPEARRAARWESERP